MPAYANSTRSEITDAPRRAQFCPELQNEVTPEVTPELLSQRSPPEDRQHCCDLPHEAKDFGISLHLATREELFPRKSGSFLSPNQIFPCHPLFLCRRSPQEDTMLIGPASSITRRVDCPQHFIRTAEPPSDRLGQHAGRERSTPTEPLRIGSRRHRYTSEDRMG